MVTADIDTVLERYPHAKRDALIPILQDVQQQHGYLSRDAVVRIGQHLRLPASKIYGVATFYNQFRFQPQGRNHVQVCRGTACHVKGSAAILDAVKPRVENRPRPDHPRRRVQPGSGGLHRGLRPGPGDLRQRRVPRRRDHQEGGKILNSYRRKASQHDGTEIDWTAPPVPSRFPGSWTDEGRGGRRSASASYRARWRNCAATACSRPTIFVGAGTCGLGAGAKDTLAAIHTYLIATKSRPTWSRSAASGICSLEPMVDVQLPGRTRVCFKQITADKVASAAGRRPCTARCPRTWSWASIATTTLTALARRALPGRASVFRPADALGAGQLRPDRSVADRRVHRPRRLQGPGQDVLRAHDARAGLRHGRGQRPAGPRRRRVPHGQEMEVRPRSRRRRRST